ncbi:MAG: transglycosylase SLT domain-containing protein [Roseivivax sp.]|nr:transglycosylase SLT domain-containing protein [Roseivivax sp.]
MSRLLALVLILIAPFAAAQTDQRPLAQALTLMRGGNWEAAMETARGDGGSAVDVIRWHYLREGLGSAVEVMDFLTRNPDWPGMPYLQEKSEPAIALADDKTVLAFFRNYQPKTVPGVMALARAQTAGGDTRAAEAVLSKAWVGMSLSDVEQALMLAEYGDLLAPYHQARLDAALWDGRADEAKAMMKRVDRDWQLLAQARLDLRAVEKGVDGRINAVPDALQSDPGLTYERFLWRVKKGRLDDALALLDETSTSAQALGRPDIWAGHRMLMARDLMQAGRAEDAYRVAANHFLPPDPLYAELEWLAGYIALRKLNRAGDAKAHFERFTAAVASPISLGRGGYWLGRAEEALGNEQAAQKAYAFGAQYQTAFYGLLAAERGRIAFDDSLRGTESFPPWREASFLRSSVFEAAVLLLAAGDEELSERFFTHLSEGLSRRQIGQLNTLLIELKQPHIQVMLGKRAADTGMQLAGPYFALHPLSDRTLPVEPELALAIARRESEFNPRVVSPAGALGLMQVMPNTAQELSGRLAESYSAARMVDDPEFNVTLGTTYLADLATRFGGNPVLIAAAYNAGPSRPDEWMQVLGDPRDPATDVIDWIEEIPFAETRNYVMRVTESLPIYRARLGKDPLPLPFSRELSGNTLLPRSP